MCVLLLLGGGICGTDLAEWLYDPVSSCLVVSQSTSCIRTIKLRSMVLSPFLLLFKTLMVPSSNPSVLDQNGRSDLNVLIRFRQAKLTQPPALLRKEYRGRTRIFRHNHFCASLRHQALPRSKSRSGLHARLWYLPHVLSRPTQRLRNEPALLWNAHRWRDGRSNRRRRVYVFTLKENVDLELGALVEPLAVGCQALSIWGYLIR